MEPDQYFPATFNLSDGPVSQVASSSVDPRVIFDSLGIRATDGSGAVLASLNADGTGTFQGHIAAGGLDLIAGDIANPTTDRRVRWHRTNYAGVVAAEMVGYYNPGSLSGAASLVSVIQSAADVSNTANLVANDPANVIKPTGAVSAQALPATDRGRVTVTVGNAAGFLQKTLLDTGGPKQSDWVLDSNWALVTAGQFANGVTNFGSGFQPAGWKKMGDNLWLVQGMVTLPFALVNGQAIFGGGPGLGNTLMAWATYQDGTNSRFDMVAGTGVLSCAGGKAAGWYWISALLAGP